MTEEEIGKFVHVTQEISSLLENELRLAGFWRNAPARNRLKGELQKVLLSEKNVEDFREVKAKRREIISRIMEVARRNHDIIVYS